MIVKHNQAELNKLEACLANSI